MCMVHHMYMQTCLRMYAWVELFSECISSTTWYYWKSFANKYSCLHIYL